MINSILHKKRIAFVSNNCWSLYNFRLDVMLGCIKNGYDVIAIAPRDEFTDTLLLAVSADSLTYREISLDNTSTDPYADLKTLVQLLKIYREESPDLIFHYVTKPIIYGSIAARMLRIPSVAIITGLGYVFTRTNFFSKIIKRSFKIALKKVEYVWFLNQENALFFEYHNIVPKHKIHIMQGEGVNTEKFFPIDRKGNSIFTFIMVSRLLWSKGIGIYMEAAELLRQKGIQAKFQLLGIVDSKHPDAIPQSQLQLWREKGLLEYLGSSDAVPQCLHQADCLVAPTFYEEGVPRSIMEAMAMEIPVIASRQVGCTDLVQDGINGYLCMPKDPFSLATCMERMILAAPVERKKMGKNGRDWVKARFDKDLIMAFYLTKIQKILS